MVDGAWPPKFIVQIMENYPPNHVDIVALEKNVLNGVRFFLAESALKRAMHSPFTDIFTY